MKKIVLISLSLASLVFSNEINCNKYYKDNLEKMKESTIQNYQILTSFLENKLSKNEIEEINKEKDIRKKYLKAQNLLKEDDLKTYIFLTKYILVKSELDKIKIKKQNSKLEIKICENFEYKNLEEDKDLVKSLELNKKNDENMNTLFNIINKLKNEDYYKNEIRKGE